MTFGARFGGLVRRYREVRGLSGAELAEQALGDAAKRSRISEIERGKVANPQAKTIAALADFLDIPQVEIDECRDAVTTVIDVPLSYAPSKGEMLDAFEKLPAEEQQKLLRQLHVSAGSRSPLNDPPTNETREFSEAPARAEVADAFEQIEARYRNAGNEMNAAKAELAEAAVAYANIVKLVDAKQSEAILLSALEGGAESIWLRISLGRLYRLLGSVANAWVHFARGLHLARSEDDERLVAIIEDALADCHIALGRLDKALPRLRRVNAIMNIRTQRDQGDVIALRDLSISYNKMGDVEVSRDNLAAALTLYEAGLEIRKSLCAKEPANTLWQRDLSVSYDRIGNVEVSNGNGENALAAFKSGLEIDKRLSSQDPSNMELQRDLSVSYNKIGDFEVSRSNVSAAFAAYHNCLEIRTALCLQDPSNTEWQRDLAISNEKLGEAFFADGDLHEAAKFFSRKQKIMLSLITIDPTNAGWQFDLVEALWRLGKVGSDPLECFSTAIEICNDLEKSGRIMPVNNWIVDDLRQRLAEAEANS